MENSRCVKNGTKILENGLVFYTPRQSDSFFLAKRTSPMKNSRGDLTAEKRQSELTDGKTADV
jgi:hypothetical protein